MTDEEKQDIKSTVSKELIASATPIQRVPLAPIETTWSALKALRDAGQLLPGRTYRMTDYQFTTSQEGTKSAGHQFDLLITADSASQLNEECRAIEHSPDSGETEGVSYFASSDLAAWKVWYCLDNDTSRFSWAVADPTDGTAPTGRGVIWRLIDEHLNDCGYDFKSALFLRASGTDIGSTTLTEDTYFYTFNRGTTEGDSSLMPSGYVVHENIVAAHGEAVKALPSNIFTGTIVEFNALTSGYCSNNTFGGNRTIYVTNSGNLRDNNFHGEVFAATFEGQVTGNTFSGNCSNNTFSGNIPYTTRTANLYASIVRPSTNTTFASVTTDANAWSQVANVAADEIVSYTPTLFRTGETMIWNYDYSGSAKTFTVPCHGTYEMECWGAQGGSMFATGGHGAYCKGNLSLTRNLNTYVYVGECPGTSKVGRTFNGGGEGDLRGLASVYLSPGGGATDIRLDNSGTFNSILSRIIIAGGGGGGVRYTIYINGGDAGGIHVDSTHYNLFSQTFLYVSKSTTAGQVPSLCEYKDGRAVQIAQGGTLANGSPTGGGGLYGGFWYLAGQQVFQGMGGSSYISGYTGCIGPAEDSTSDNIISSGSANHYSGYVFTNSQMIAGNASMPAPAGGTETGHSGNGYARITFVP